MNEPIPCIIFIALLGSGAIYFIVSAFCSRRNRAEKIAFAVVLTILCALFVYLMFRDVNEQPKEETKDEETSEVDTTLPDSAICCIVVFHMEKFTLVGCSFTNLHYAIG